MKNLGHTIDQIIAVEPKLEEFLLPIKTRWKKYNGRDTHYWKQILSVLNSEITSEHPKRQEIKELLSKKKKMPKKRNTFESRTSSETVLGVIPENLECKIRRYDRQQIELAKRNVEARLTHDKERILEINRKMEILNIKHRKIWADLKDHFNLWNVDGSIAFLIRAENSLLIMTAIKMAHPQKQIGPKLPSTEISNLIIEVCKGVFRYFNINLPGLPEA